MEKTQQQPQPQLRPRPDLVAKPIPFLHPIFGSVFGSIFSIWLAMQAYRKPKVA